MKEKSVQLTQKITARRESGPKAVKIKQEKISGGSDSEGTDL
jgi:hypothetical protein